MERLSVDNLSIGILARNSLSVSSRRASQISLLADTTASEQYHHIDDRNWSWSFLRNSFRINDLQDLYHRYVRRIQNAYFNVYLILQIVLSLLYILTLISLSLTFDKVEEDFSDCNNNTEHQDKSALDMALPEIFTHAIIIVFCVIAAIIAWNEKVFRSNPRYQVLLSGLTTFVLVASDLGLSFYFDKVFCRIRTAQGFQTLIIVYFFLPLPKKVEAAVLGCLVTVSHLIFTGVFFRDNYEDKTLILKLISEFVFYVCANLVGMYSQLLSEVTVRRAFMDRRGYIKSTIKKQYEKKQEEQLLQSILPKHISFKVKEELLKALKHIGSESEQHHQRHDPQHHHHHNNHRPHGTGPDSGHGVMNRKPFSDLYVEKHQNVTILFADIVNFTPLTVKLKADELVDTLNELFGRFDDAATNNNCLRIKLLGDCYYCVSGLSMPTPDHAKNCVRLGLEMIEIIKDVREGLNVDVAMRIGIHSGNILSGLLGVYKWQYDIWSKDVTIANHMEQSGKAGRVHVTKQTKEFLGNEYQYEDAHGGLRDNYLKTNKVETFFIANKRAASTTLSIEDNEEGDHFEEISSGRKTFHAKTAQSRRGSTMGTVDALIKRKSLRINPDRRNYLSNDDVQTFRSMMDKVNEQMEKAIDEMPLRKSDQWCRRGSSSQSGQSHNAVKDQNSQNDHSHNTAAVEQNSQNGDSHSVVEGQNSKTGHSHSISEGQNSKTSFSHSVNPLWMNFDSFGQEVQFQTQQDPLFKFYVGCSLVVLICIGIIQSIKGPPEHLVLWVSFGVGLSSLLLLIPFLWVSYLWSRMKDPHRELDEIPEPENKFIRYFYSWSNSVSNSWALRTTMYAIITMLIATFAIVDVIECDKDFVGSNHTHHEYEDNCHNPWYFTYSCSLAILAIYAFFRIHFLLKLLMSLVSLAAYGATMFQFRDYVFKQKEGVSPALSAVGAEVYSHFIYLIWITLLLHIMDRQMEYINRLDFIWKRKLTEEHKEASLIHSINTILIENILPMQIAKIYLDPNRSGEGHNRGYKNVSVMFASIPNFMDFYTENDLNDSGMKCLQLLNEIIVEFDQAIFDHADVEKIKVIGSTYMAACGLEVNDAGRLSTTSLHPDHVPAIRDPGEAITDPRQESKKIEKINDECKRRNLVTLIEFSIDMMTRLHAINKDAFQDFHLRVGIAAGPVVAGVIGVQKPLYDIWGDTVNLASRMDSTGIPGKIQISEQCAKHVMEAGISCERRGPISVKGKGIIETYFVSLSSKYQLMKDIGPTPGSTDL